VKVANFHRSIDSIGLGGFVSQNAFAMNGDAVVLVLFPVAFLTPTLFPHCAACDYRLGYSHPVSRMYKFLPGQQKQTFLEQLDQQAS
jgi:hypothetical protein